MSAEILRRLRALLGDHLLERDPDGLPRATPDRPESLALVCQLAADEGWKLRIEGQGTWLPADAPADLAVSSRGLTQIVSVSPADLVATVQTGVPLDSLRRRLADDGMWLALDPPGRPERSIGSVMATATAGPLRTGFGPVRDHVLGCTVVTGDGRVIQPGGRVVKNVAGYDLTRLQVGAFGGFGVVTEVHLRLRALPRADVTFVTRGSRDQLTRAGRDLLAAGTELAALELLSPALAADAEWLLAARLLGGEAGVQEAARQLQGIADLTWHPIEAERSSGFWGVSARAALSGPVTVRLGVLVDGLDEALDLVAHELDEGLVSAGAACGGLRWTGTAPVEHLRRLRHLAAAREIPMTLERAPWNIRHALGHFGAYRDGVGRLVVQLRDTFDPSNALSIPLEGTDG